MILDQMPKEDKNGTGNMLGSSTLSEKCVNQENKLPSRRHKLLQIETFVEEVLQEVWNEVFSCLPQIEHKVKNPPELGLKGMPHCISMQNKCLKLDYGCSNVSNRRFKNDDFNFQTIISYHETSNGCHTVETVDNNMEATNKHHLASTSLKSVGCVNPSFLGSSINPDLLEYAVGPDAPTTDCDASSLSRGVSGLNGEDARCFDDTDSGFNTVSLESNHHTDDTDCFKIDSEHSNIGQPIFVVERTETASYTADPNEIHLTELQPCISADSHFNDKAIETKDDAQEYNQTNHTSVDIRLPNTYRNQESGIRNVDLKSQKSNIQQRKSKECYHTRNLRRLVSEIFSSSGTVLLIRSMLVHM
jgi:hypothetical protein